MAAGVLAALLGLSPTAATAQTPPLTTTERTFLSNEDQVAGLAADKAYHFVADYADLGAFNNPNGSIAQTFTTGAFPVDIVPRKLTLWFGSTNIITNADDSNLTVAIWRNNGSTGEPRDASNDGRYIVFSRPSDLAGGGAKEFTFSGERRLGSNVTYHIVVQYSRNFLMSFVPIEGTSGAAPTAASENLSGWSVGALRLGEEDNWHNPQSANTRLRFKLEGVRHPVAATGEPAITPAIAPATIVPLTARPGFVVDDNGLPENVSDYNWQWQQADTQNAAEADWMDIMGATEAGYTPNAAVVGKHLRAVVSFTDLDGYQETRASAGTAAVRDVAPPVVTVAATPDSIVGRGTPAVTFTLTRTGGVMAVPLTVGIAITGDGLRHISNPTEAVFEADMPTAVVSIDANPLAEGDDDQSVTLTLQDGTGYTVGAGNAAMVDIMAPVNNVATGKPSLSGTARVDETLTAGLGNIMDDDDQPVESDLLWQWQRQETLDDNSSWEDIDSETSRTYTLGTEDEGLRVRVRAMFRDSVNQIFETLFSDPTTAVAPAPSGSPATGMPTFTGLGVVGEILTASLGTVDDADGLPMGANAFRYRWQSRGGGSSPWSDISGATGTTYTLLPRDSGRRVRVVVSFTDNGNNPEERASEPSFWVEAVAVPEVTVRVEDASVVGDGMNDVVFILEWTGNIATRGPLPYDLLDPADGIDDSREGADRQGTLSSSPLRFELETQELQAGEDDKVVTFTIRPNSGYTLSGPSITVSATVTAPVSTEVTVAAKAGGENINAGTDNAVFVLTRTGGDMSADLPVTFSVTSTGMVLRDTSRTTATIPASMATVEVSLQTRSDPDNPVMGTVTLTVEDPGDGSYTAGGAGGDSADIMVTQRTLPFFSIQAPAQAEVDEGGSLVFTINLDIPAIMAFTVTTRLCADSEATVDDIQGNGMIDVDFGVDDTMQPFTVVTLADSDAAEGDETLCMSFDSVPNPASAARSTTTPSDARAEVTIRDAAAPAPMPGGVPEVTVGVAAATVVGDGTNQVEFTFTWTGSIPGNEPFTIDLLDPDDGIDGGAFEDTGAQIGTGGATGPHNFRLPTRMLPPGADDRVVTLTLYPAQPFYTVAGTGTVMVTVTAQTAGPAPAPAPAPTGTPATGMPTISGTLRVGEDVTAVTTGISDADGPAAPAFSYQWRRADDAAGANEADIAGATSATYTLGTADAGKHLQVVASFTDDGGTNERVASAWTEVDNTPAEGTPSISGTVRAGQTVTAVTTGISDADGPATPAFSYQWRRADDAAGASEADIAGATSATYTLDADDTGKHLQVVVSFTDGGGTNERVASAWTEVGNSPARGRPRISGAFVIGEDVTAVTTGISDADGPAAPAFSYQWRRADDRSGANEADIGGETSASYTLVAADADKYLQVVVSFTDGGGTNERVASAWTPVSDRPATGEPLVTGTAEVGRTLTVDTTGITDPDGELVFSFTWARDTETPNLWEDIGSQTQENTYLAVAADLGRRLRVQVVATDALGGVSRLTSTPTSVVLAAGSTPPEPGPPPDPAQEAARLREATSQSLALLASNVAANTVQVLTSRFEGMAAGGGASTAANLGGRPLGAFAGEGASAADLAREVAGLFGLHLPAAGRADAATGAAAAAGAGAAAGAAAGSGFGASPTVGSPGAAYTMPGAAYTAPGAAAHSFDAHSTEAHVGRGRGANDAGDAGDWRAFEPGGAHSPDLRNLLAQSSFSVQLGAAHAAHGGASGASHFTLWGKGSASGFEGEEKESALEIDGESTSAYLGFDVQSGDLALGLAVGHSEGELDYAGGGAGELETELTGLHPYLHWTRSRDTSMYAMLGYGFGEATLDDAGLTESLTSDLDMRMLAVGLHHALPGTGTGRHYGVKLDAFWVDFESDGAGATAQDGVVWQAVESQSGRVRLALTGSAPLAQGSGADGLLAEGELAARLDAGDAQTAKLGAEFGAGLRWVQGGFSLSARARALLVLGKGDFEDYEEWGASLEASYQAGGMGRGLRFTLSPAWGETQSGADALYESAGALRGLGESGGRQSRSIGGLPDRLDFELGYGLAALGGRAELLPFGRFSLAGAGAAQTRLRLGTRLGLPPRAGDALAVHSLGIELFGETQAGAEGDRRIALELRLGF